MARALAPQWPAFAARGAGALLFDVDGRPYVDLAGGVGCLAVGHAHPKVVRAVQDQAARFFHTDYVVFPYEGYVAVCERLCASTPGRWRKKAALFNSGAEAVENAVKIARTYTGRSAVVAFEGAFHGRTYMALSLTSRVVPYKAGFGPFAPEVYRVPYPYPYRSPFPTEEQTVEFCLRRLEDLFTLHVEPERVAAVVVEPVLGEGGVVVPPASFLPRLREICRRHEILLVVDEVQTGMGRTGRMWASEHVGVEPDLMVVGKSLAAGLPLSAVVGRAEVVDSVREAGIGGTYVGNPLSCAAALAVFEVLEEEGLLERARTIGQALHEGLGALQLECPLVGEVRGLGAMVGVELVTDRDRKTPAPDHVGFVLRRAAERGALALRAGVFRNVIRLLPPLVLREEELSRSVSVLGDCLREACRRPELQTG
ncbi:MAG: 4-aminobutyrate--2-oxoglutarate transaminase [Armatimonadota bacterium]|nr:4-aminobutyrate--2-oxoglutarate transaminase [Armatimonadota bacterium]MDW8155509.1 4-aminobutyrate--2-oxoglutarate transaminase [Armatimonadota bacterium]